MFAVWFIYIFIYLARGCVLNEIEYFFAKHEKERLTLRSVPDTTLLLAGPHTQANEQQKSIIKYAK